MSFAEKPLKVALFAGEPLSGSTIEMLVNQQRLAGVMLPEQIDMFAQQVGQALQQANLNVAQFNSSNLSQLDALFKQWEADLVLLFGFDSSLVDIVSHTTLPCFNCFVGEGPYAGANSIYWQVREQQSEGTVRLCQLSCESDESKMVSYQQAIAKPFKIDDKDTAQCVENMLLQGLPSLVHECVELWAGNKLQLQAQEVVNSQVRLVDEQVLSVDWRQMSSQQICAMARAGNPRFGGCSVKINNTVINLLQASAVQYSTYGVSAGVICCNSESDGVIVATVDGAIRIDILSNADGVFTGLQFCERFGIFAGMAFG